MIKKGIKKLKNLTAVEIIKESVKDFTKNDSMTFAASTAFYTIFSMPGLLIIVLTIAAAFYSEGEVREEMLNQVSDTLGSDSAETFDNIMQNAAVDETSIWARVVGIAVLIFSATTVFVSLQNSINHIWHIRPKPERGILKFLINRALSFSMVASIGFVLIVSLVIDALIVIFFRYLAGLINEGTLWLASAVNFLFAQGILVVIFGLMYKILPDARVRWRDVWLGAFVTMLLFALGKYLLGFYMANSDVGSAYGTAGSLVFVLIWIYYSVVIFLFGAQITFYIAEKIGGNIKPLKEAVRVELMEVDWKSGKIIKNAEDRDQEVSQDKEEKPKNRGRFKN
ncbi:YihY/virulence factor BrkB family protein [Litoribacter alkaliphilus]|uniref:YihY/virulence factor BrkB family protein n=1 Tax=Litoribacter ruber TaxID=702568 RepID=A0AAP2G1S2_9BACT|nr:YihY/virulence factor BrkB family protein [Litoribacter alkaliphilus]MBS9524647.1 YihY/virulence factor BrkB family protein [Litoribacter alkaliphilus]